MEYKSIRIDKKDKGNYIRDYCLFYWTLNQEIDQGDKVILNFCRDEKTPQLYEIKQLEKQYFSNTKKISLPLVISACAIAAVYLTTMAILIICNILNLDTIGKVLVLALPAAVILLILTIYTFLTTRRMMEATKYGNNKYQYFVKEIDKIKE